MVVGGLGGGIIAALNQTVMLTDVPIANGGLAASVGQLALRIGNAIGITMGISVFLAGGSAGSAALGFRDGIALGLGLTTIATVMAAIDIRRGSRDPRPRRAGGRTRTRTPTPRAAQPETWC